MNQPQLHYNNHPVQTCLSPHPASSCCYLEDNLTRDDLEEKCDEVSCDVRSVDTSESVTPNLSPAYIWPVEDL